ncbi:MAG: tetratricopeptide repeat protein [Candidatus Eremiobacteraeota bacterium]|nr:tetratricopeptide repeat protein [Candidatus Eremiobacteraeota bacterium]
MGSESLPSGSVTFAFTDIEGSTARRERDGASMQEAVRRHDEILRSVIMEHGGHVFKTIGDAFCSAFARSEDAVAAMVAAQRALGAEDFANIDGLRIRAAIHTGTVDERDGDYFGPALNKVARVLAIGHGGQILVTAETAALVDGALPSDVSLRDLGSYHLKDFAEPQRLYQVVAAQLMAEFPPLRSLGTLPGNIAIVDVAEFRPVATFSGRDEELGAVDAALSRDGAIALVHGLGGVGKSSIVREYGWRNRDAYSIVWWLNAETETGIVDGLLRLGAMFVTGLDKLPDRRAAARRVVNSLLGGLDKPVLLVFDNLEDERLLRTWLPRWARALATSRDAVWSTDITVIPLQTWSVATAIEYLQTASGRADLSETDARAIAQSLGALPLALAHAAAALRGMRMITPQRYLDRIKEHLRNTPRAAEYRRSVAATFSESIVHAEQQAPGAAALVCFAACFAPDAIPEELFRQATACYDDDLRPSLPEALDLRSTADDCRRLDEALGALDRLSLLAFAESSRTHSMHRLVQRAALDLIHAVALRWYECAVVVADAAFPKPEFSAWPQCERLLPHARIALGALPSDAQLISAANLAARCGEYLWRRGEYRAAEQLCLQALTIQENAFGSDHLDVARSLNALANVYIRQGRYAEAELLLTRALTAREKVLGPDHLDVATILINLAIIYDEQGRYADAERLYARTLEIRERLLGPHHPEVAGALNNLANAYYEQGRYAEALALLTRARAIWEKAFGPNHPDVATSLDNIASVYRQQGAYEDAEMLCARALAIREAALGPDYPEVAQSLHNLADIYAEQGRHAETEPLLTRALGIYEKALGEDHPWTKATRDALKSASVALAP